MLIEKRNFLKGMNGDISPRLLGDGESLNIMNGRVGVTQYGRFGRVENVPGTTLVSQNVRPPYGTDQTIGSALDFDNQRLLFFNYNTVSDHGIYCYDVASNIIYAVLYDSQVIGGLGFRRNSLIHSARVENGCLYWCDSTNNEPRRIDINAGIEMNRAGTFPSVTPYSYPMTQSVIRWIRRQPGLPIAPVKSNDGNFNNNFIKNEAFEFSWRYIYRNYEISTLSAWSILVNYNIASSTDNYIHLTVPLGETIDQDVLQVDLIAKYLNGGKSFIIRSWNKNIPLDNLAIYQHNHSGIPLTFRFYNDSLGVALDDAYSVKPFDSVPVYAQTMEMARFRSFMANYVIGYDTPITTSLTAIPQVDQNAGAVTAIWLRLIYNSGANTKYFVSLGTLGFFDPSANPPQASLPYGSLTFISLGWGDFTAYIVAHFSGIVSLNYSGDTSPVTGAPPLPGLIGDVVFKSGSTYQVAIEFLDHSGRKCGVLTNDDLKVTIDEKVYAQDDFTTAVNWALSNANATNEIPIWTYYYSINITKNLTTRFFLDARVVNMTYASKDADGLYIYNTSAYSTTLNGVAIDITRLNNYGMGYVFQEGDLVKVYISTSVYNLSIIAQDGNWIICELQNLGTLGSSSITFNTALFEIYTPYKTSTSEPYYECSQIYKITNPATVSRTYSTLSGSITGDVTLLSRNDGTADYVTENMSPNDKFYRNWNTNTGRPNFIELIGQQTLTNAIAWSNTLIQETKTNGLSTFDALDTKDVNLECGDIQKLQLANKISEDQGNIMLAICSFETASLYLGETQLVSQQGNAFVAQSSGVIGTINVLQGSSGTLNPESVVEYLGLVFWLDVHNGFYTQYSVNGLESVSRYRMSRFFKNYCIAYQSTNNNNLDNINGFHHVRSSIDPFHKEVTVTLPALIYENYANVLPSYSSVPSYATSIIDRFDISDQLGKTMAFKFEGNENSWGSNYEWLAEWSEYLGDVAYGFKNGNLYIFNHNTSAWNTIFGVQYPVRICCTGNLNPSSIKDLFNISLESNVIPDFTVAKTTYPNIQITDLSATDYTNEEEAMYAYFLRDRLSPNVSGTADQKLYTGDVLKDFSIFVMTEFQQYSQLMFVNFINLAYQQSYGQRNLTEVVNP